MLFFVIGEYLSSVPTILQLPESFETLKRLKGLSARNQQATLFCRGCVDPVSI